MFVLSNNCNLKQVFKFLPFCLIFLLMVFSCNKEKEAPDGLALTDAQKIQAARAWFEKYHASGGRSSNAISLYTRSGGNEEEEDTTIKATPDWENAWVGEDGVVEVPLIPEGRISYAFNAEPSDEQLGSAITQLLIFENEEEPMAALMHMVGDSGYVAGKNYDLNEGLFESTQEMTTGGGSQGGYKKRGIGYKNMADDFSGIVFFTLLEGDFCNGWRYENGQITGRLNYTGTFIVPEINGDLPLTRSYEVCYYLIIDHYVEWCYSYKPQCDPWVYLYSDIIELSCGSIPGGGPPPGQITPPGSGNNPGGNQPTYYTVSVTAVPSDGGNVSGGAQYKANANCNISATPADGFVFNKWTDESGVVRNTPSFNVKITGDKQFFCYFNYSPCSRVSNMNQNSEMSAAVNNLKADAKNLSHEMARYAVRGTNGTVLPLENTGYSDFVTFPRPLGYNKYEWMFHSHHQTDDHTLSAGDIWDLVNNICRFGLIADYSSFIYGVVDAKGTAYGIMISNIVQFNQFIHNNKLYDENAKWYKNLNSALKKSRTSAIEMENAFASRLLDSGLSIMKNNLTSLSPKWEQIEYNTANTQVETKPCN